MGWVISATPRQLYLRERPGTHYIGGWVGPRAGLDWCGKFRPHRNSIPRPSNQRRVAIPTELSRSAIRMVRVPNTARSGKQTITKGRKMRIRFPTQEIILSSCVTFRPALGPIQLITNEQGSICP